MILKHFAVIGYPITQSLSPQLHQTFAENAGLKLCYEKYSVEPQGRFFEEVVRDFFRQGGAGLNITSPFKQRAFCLVDQLTARARLAGAVNTLIPLSTTKLLGDNTDGVGLMRDLKEQYPHSLAGKRILILGAGGATKGILAELLAENPQKILIASRRVDERDHRIVAYKDLTTPFDLIINATPLSLLHQLPPVMPAIVHAKSFCYDLVYNGQRETIFTRWAHTQGVSASDGLGMLIYQAAEAFYQWHHVRPVCDAALLATFLS